ncbi:MAG: PD-(D/E)XK nuclease family protein, partial [Chloroflexi bacterium]|nr:PD-(D/E)XK nuclease family protein [Chloroflexota bacterium]
MMVEQIRPGHLFSQHSLNTYLRCPHRFWLKYIQRQPWPMPEEEDPRAYQEHLLRGTVFHQWLVRRHLGMDMEPIVAACPDLELRRWWQALQDLDESDLPQGLREVELPLVVPLGVYSLYARFDLLAVELGERGAEAVVVDWKTLPSLPSLRTLRERVQTRVYLYALVTAGHVITGGAPIYPERAAMWYWFANFPEEMVRIPYSQSAYERDGQWLRALAYEIANK